MTFISLLSIGENQFHVLADNDDHEIRGRSGMLGLGFGDKIWDDDDCRLVVNPKLEDGKEQKPQIAYPRTDWRRVMASA